MISIGENSFILRIGTSVSMQGRFDTPMGTLRDRLLPIIRSTTDISALSQLFSDWNSLAVTYQRKSPSYYSPAIVADVKNEITDQIKKLTPEPVVQEPEPTIDSVWISAPTPIIAPIQPNLAPIDRGPKSVSPSSFWRSPTVLILGGLGILAGLILLKKKGR